MPQARPQSYVALALATLAVMLAAWWAWDAFTTLEPVSNESASQGTFLPPDEYPPPDAPEATPQAAETEPDPEMLEAGRPPLAPPELKPPTLVAPRVRDGDAAAEAAPRSSQPNEEEPGRRDDLRSPSDPSTLLGGVARPNERATAEVRAEGGSGWIGSPPNWVANLGRQRQVVPYVALPMEAPRHREEFEPFFLDRFEVSNHRYWEFMRDTASVLYRTSGQPDRTLVQITEYIILDPPTNLDLADVTARQLFRANSAVLLQAFKNSVVLTDEDSVDFDATFLAIRDRIVPRGIDLRFYERAPPGTWPDSRYVEGEMDHPVRDVSVEDATAFALFRGRYLPTEMQWEYAARGRRGLDWPWGSDGSLFDERVNGGQARTDDTRPRTVSVFQFANGASWLGAFQMLGNVSEWTSSFLDAYPAGVRTLPGAPERQVVVRGGSAFDQERYLTRPAFRGWLATDPNGAPRSNQRRAWTGIRTARYGTTARPDAVHGRVPTMHFRGRKYRRLEPSSLQPAVYAGFEGLHTERFLIVVDEDPRLARRKPRPGVKAMVINPLATVSLVERGRWQPNTDEKLITAAQLAAQRAPVLYALLHTDVHLVDLWHAADDSQRVFAVPSRFRRADVSPGTYFVASVGGYLCLLTTDMRDVWYLSNRPAPEAALNVIEQRYLTPVRAPVVEDFRLSSADRLNVDIKVPMHATAAPGRAARVTFQLRPDELETRRLIEVQQRQGSR